MEVVRIKKILAWNLLIYIGLHCVRRSSWTVTTLATLIYNFAYDMQKKLAGFPCAKKIYISWEKSGMQKWTKSRFFAGNKVRWFCTIIEKRCTAEKWLFIIIMLSRLMIYEHFSLSVLQAGVKMSIKAKCLPRNVQCIDINSEGAFLFLIYPNFD